MYGLPNTYFSTTNFGHLRGKYKELGDKYVPDKIEKKRKDYLKSELKKLGYDVKLTKKKD